MLAALLGWGQGTFASKVILGDGHVDVVDDITLMAGQFGNSVPPAPVRYDIAPATPDHVIDVIGDISRLAGLFGQSCAP